MPNLHPVSRLSTSKPPLMPGRGRESESLANLQTLDLTAPSIPPGALLWRQDTPTSTAPRGKRPVVRLKRSAVLYAIVAVRGWSLSRRGEGQAGRQVKNNWDRYFFGGYITGLLCQRAEIIWGPDPAHHVDVKDSHSQSQSDVLRSVVGGGECMLVDDTGDGPGDVQGPRKRPAHMCSIVVGTRDPKQAQGRRLKRARLIKVLGSNGYRSLALPSDLAVPAGSHVDKSQSPVMKEHQSWEMPQQCLLLLLGQFTLKGQCPLQSRIPWRGSCLAPGSSQLWDDNTFKTARYLIGLLGFVWRGATGADRPGESWKGWAARGFQERMFDGRGLYTHTFTSNWFGLSGCPFHHPWLGLPHLYLNVNRALARPWIASLWSSGKERGMGRLLDVARAGPPSAVQIGNPSAYLPCDLKHPIIRVPDVSGIFSWLRLTANFADELLYQ